MTLLHLKEGACAEIGKFNGGKGFVERLNAMGLFKGNKVRLKKAAPFSGPLMIEDVCSGACIMIGRGMADQIEVISGGSEKP
jgi:Fe2+ transport system protein FeoA